MSINQFKEKIKGFIEGQKEELLLSLIIIFVGLGSFGLGKLSALEDVKGQIEIKRGMEATVNRATQLPKSSSNSSYKPPEQVTQPSTSQSQLNEVVVASKSGTKYHFPWCSGAKRISEKNKITFNTIEEARKAGYTPAGNCKGLK